MDGMVGIRCPRYELRGGRRFSGDKGSRITLSICCNVELLLLLAFPGICAKSPTVRAFLPPDREI